jgi:hypothetical protein
VKERYGKSLRDQLDHFPVWDVGTRVELGDYGVIEDDCFSKQGNIVTEYQSTLDMTSSGAPAFWEFTSEGTLVTEAALEAGVASVEAKAKMELSFKNAYSLYLLAAESFVSSIANLAEVTRELHHHPKGWNYKRVIVRSVRKTSSLVLLMNTSARSSIVLSGDPGALADLKGGRVSASSRIQVTGDAGLRSFGERGAVYVDLARVRRWGGGPKAAADNAPPAADVTYELVPARDS